MAQYQYDAWGNIINTTDTSGKNISSINPYRYRGYRYDNETGWYYLNSRYYNPEIGRFINADGLIGETGDILGHNMYSYCKNNPVMMVDPNGYLSFRIPPIPVPFINPKRNTQVLIKIIAKASSIIFPTAGDLMSHAAQDNPRDLNYGDDSNVTQKIIESQEFQNAINNLSNKYNSQSSFNDTVGLKFSSGDLLLAFHSTEMNVSGTKLEDGSWSYNIHIYDYYDFKKEKWNSIPNIVNNCVLPFQTTNIINNYNIYIDFEYKR